MGCDVECERKRRIKDNQKVFTLGTWEVRVRRKRDEKAIGRIVAVGGVEDQVLELGCRLDIHI